MSNLNQVLKKNIAGSFMVKGVGIMVNLALIPIGIQFLDKERFGVWVVINSLLTWFTYFDLGLGNGMRNKVTHAISKRHIKEARQLVSTGYISIFTTTLSIFLVFYFANRFISWSAVFNVSPALNAELSKVIFWAITLFLVQLFFKNIGFILLSVQLTAINNSLVVISNILSLIVIYCCRFYGLKGSLLSYAIIVCGGPVVTYVVTSIVFFFSRRFSFLRPGISHFNRSMLKNMGGLGLKFFVIQIAALILFQGNNIFITQFFGPAAVTSYNVSYRYFNIVLMSFSILLSPFWSAYTKAYTENNFSWIRSIIGKLKKVWASSIIAIVLMVVAANYVINLWVGSEVKVPTLLNVANGLAVIIYSWNIIYLYFLNGIGKIQLQYYLTIVVLVIYVPITILLLRLFKDPAVIIFSNCFVQFLFSIFCWLQVKKILKGETHGIWYR